MKPHRPPERYNTHFKTGMPWIRAIQELPDLLGVPQPLAAADAAHLGEGSPSQQRGFQQCHCHIAAPRFPAHPEVYHWATHTAAYSCTKQLYSVCFNCAQVHSWSGHRRRNAKKKKAKVLTSSPPANRFHAYFTHLGHTGYLPHFSPAPPHTSRPPREPLSALRLWRACFCEPQLNQRSNSTGFFAIKMQLSVPAAENKHEQREQWLCLETSSLPHMCKLNYTQTHT